jgi:hypothetical protein
LDDFVKREERPLSLGDLVGTLGSQLVSSLTGTIALEQLVSVPVVYDSLDELPDVPGGVLLMAGVDPASPETSAAVVQAAARGFCAVVIKSRGSDHTELVRIAQAIPIAVLSVVDDAPWTHVSNLVTALMRSRSISDHATGTAGGDLFVLANAVSNVFGGAVAIEDLDRNLLAYSNLEHHRIDQLRRNGILARQVPDRAKHAEQYRTVMLAEGIVRFPFDPSDGELPRCAAAVRAGREELGSIWVIEPDGPAGPDAEIALLEATRLAAIQILQARSSINLERQVRAEWLRSGFDGPGTDQSSATRFGLLPHIPSVVVAFEFKQSGALSTQPLARQLVDVVEQHCAAFRANISCVSIGSIAYVLFPAVREADFPLLLARGAAAAVESRLGHGVYAAISSPRAGSDQLAGLRREADEVLSVLMSTPGLPDVADATEIQSEMLLTHLERELKDKSRLRHPGVSALIEHDRAKGTDYRDSLCAYFAALGDVGAAARALNVHPNTLRYRVKRAESLFRLRLSRPDDRLAIWLQLRLAKP